jgi:hypothetical protein
MPFLAYIAVILVSLGGILFELNWLTSPKLETKPAVQASKLTTSPKLADATGVSREAETPAPNAPPQQTASAPPITPAPVFSAAETAGQTTGSGSTDFKREFSTDAKADSTKSDRTMSSATFTPAVTAPTPTSTLAVASNNKCDIAACSAAYQSFRASDCTYQPMDGNARKVCDRTQGGAQQAAVPLRERKIEASIRKPSKDAELRAVEREVRRITDREMATAPGVERGMGRSEVIVYERPNRDW